MYEKIIIVTESIFSMDGDEADLQALVRLKHNYSNVLLYVDEAHAFGARGKKGLGCAEEQNCINDIDFLIGTFGKAAASAGAYIICRQIIREYLINKRSHFPHLYILSVNLGQHGYKQYMGIFVICLRGSCRILCLLCWILCGRLA